ncbi:MULTISPECIES: cytochrome P450 [Cyanophyceae]|uniref:Cytochrome P450 n=1 Tax=Leptolyngbya subtilissima DQ-A4 TaxID=2933933 RepID=A0ABV0JXW0_9CYAN|nr:cytochrome P450 [Nodosilinea sp. FACHB-141]MBD2111987.1 cytochrome P450 [Nodosilinea sp. FACHB-141]
MPTLPGSNTPFWQRAPKLILRPLDYFEDNYRRYGSVFQVGEKPPSIYVADPAVIQAIFQADAAQFHIPSQSPGSGLTFLLGNQSLLLLDGERHRRHRRLLMPPFHGDRMRAYGDVICTLTKQAMASWQPGTAFNVRAAMQDITLRVILKAVFGLGDGDRYDRLRQLLSTLLEGLGTPFSAFFIFFPGLQKDWGPMSPWGRFVRIKSEIDALIYAEISDRRQQPYPDGTDILSMMISARDAQGEPLSDGELHDELMTLLVAGHETTASALAWSLYWVHWLPEVNERLHQELDAGGLSADPLADANLPYLTAVCQETLRIYPVAPTTGIRILNQPMTVAGYEFPSGAVLFPNIYLLHHREDLYPEPKAFRPKRFLERQYSPYEYVPFGGGHRSCIGSAFALMEMKLVLATILRHWELELPEGLRRPLKPVRRGLTLAPPGNLRMTPLAQRAAQRQALPLG